MGANASYPDKPQQTNSKAASLYRGPNGNFGEGESVTKEKKKKLSKLQTLRKKFTRVRRHSRSFDYAKAFREYSSHWTIRELSGLVDEYEASLTLKELSVLANSAHPPANSIKKDLSNLYDYKFCTDLDLIYRGTRFPVHRAILSARCPFFREMLKKYPGYGAQIPVDIRTHGVDTRLFSALLRYLYTGEFSREDSKYENLDILVHLRQEFGTPNLLEVDLRNLLDTGEYSDTVLVFASEIDCHEPLSSSCEGDLCGASSSSSRLELPCHKAVLAARSPFFRNLLIRRARSGEEITEYALNTSSRIVLDESIIPRQYARVLLHALYMDSVDLGCVVRSSISSSSLSEVQAIVAGKGHLTHADEAMEIHQIGLFLDFPVLSQGCEDIIVDNLNVDNLTSILSWSSEPHGSSWVHRQALHFLREEFIQIAHGSTLSDLSKDYLLEAIQSDFLQASEADVLSAVLKWGEHQLMKRMEEREPNLLTHTAHSVSKKGVKKRDLSDVELRDILSDLLPHVRADHIIPPNHEVLCNAIKRGLISTPPSHMIGDEGNLNRVCAWIRGKNSGMFVKPRLFQPYYDEAKALLDEQLAQVQENEVVHLRTIHMSNIPDTLYMVEGDSHGAQHYPGNLPSAATVDVIAGTILVPDQDTMQAMLRREAEHQRSELVRRACCLPCSDRRMISHQVQLRVVREFGLPDSTVQVFQTGQLFAAAAPALSRFTPSHFQRPPQPRVPRSHKHHHHYYQVTSSSSSSSSPPPPPHLYGPVAATRSYSSDEKETSSYSESVLSDMMPDIAMATSSVNQMSIQDDIELDLGDGNSHPGTLYI